MDRRSKDKRINNKEGRVIELGVKGREDNI